MADLINVLLPFFLFVGAGYLLIRMGGLDYSGERTMGSIVHWVALPLLFLKTGVLFDFDVLVDTTFPTAIVGSQFLTFAFVILVATWFFPGKITHLTLHSAGAVGSNTLSFGVPLLYLLFGQDIMPALIIAILLMQTPIVFLTAWVGEQEIHHRTWSAPLWALWQSIANPYWAMLLVGVILNHFNTPIPVALTDIMDIGANMAVGLCLLYLGTQIVVPQTLSSAGEVGWIVLAKLILYPLCAWGVVTYVITMDPMLSALVVLTSAMPMGGVIMHLPQSYETFQLQAKTTAWMSLILSLVTMPPIIYYYITLTQ